MKKKLPLLIAVLIAATAVVGTSIAVTQQPVAVIELVSWSPKEIHDAGLDQPVSAGLSVVGVEERVYLRGVDDEGEEVTSYMWSIASAPDGSVATLESTSTEETSFTPDLVGVYMVELTITTASGQATATQRITAAEYVGVGNQGGQTPDVVAGQCGLCHSGNTEAWGETGHATMFTEAIDGLKSSHYNANCIECHTVGYREDADNGGFDDVAEMLGWEFPDTLVEGNWQDIVDNFPQLANLSNIQCENCHGAGSLHKGDRRNIAIDLDAGVCGSCHEEDPYHVKNVQWKNSAHATGTSFARGTSSTCAPCHSGWGFIARMDPLSDLRTTTGDQNISCAVCHDPHDATYSHQLRSTEDVQLVDGTVVTVGEEGKLCMNCHLARREKAEYLASDPNPFRGGHGSVQSEALFGTNVWDFGRLLPNSTHKDVVEQACVTCHMSESPGAGEPGFQKLGEHSWAMHTTEVIDGEEITVDNVAACRNCHIPDMESFDDMLARADHDGDGETEPVQEEVHGLLEHVAVLLPPFGEAEVDIRDTTMTDLQKKALWNYLLIEEDGSFGVHNFQFAVAVLQLTEEALNYGVLSPGEIVSVTDVPNDQGKQVEVQWTRFGGDGVSDQPIQTYYVWRKSEATSSKDRPLYGSLRAIPAEGLASSATLAYNGDVWTQVASQPAAGLDIYSAIAPTLYDSTADDGVRLTDFMVSGHTSDSQVYVTSAPASGYSVDNLAPRAPSNLVSKVGRSWINLTWDEPVDPDFDYFVVYRGTEPGFDPDVVGPRRAVTSPQMSDQQIQVGMTYYYRVAAVDFSGNRSEFSDETTPNVVTGLEEAGGVPEEFALHPAYPNPFNPSTHIRYDVPASSRVSIALYNIVGQVTDVLVNGTVPAGSHTVTIDAGGLPSGLYIVRMETSEGVFERTITLLR